MLKQLCKFTGASGVMLLIVLCPGAHALVLLIMQQMGQEVA